MREGDEVAGAPSPCHAHPPKPLLLSRTPCPAAALTCTSESRILPASLRRSAAPRYCCRWKELSRVLICSALKAVRSRRPLLPPGSAGPEHSALPSGAACPAPQDRPPAPGHRGEGEKGQLGPGISGVSAHLQAASAQLHLGGALRVAQGPSVLLLLAAREHQHAPTAAVTCSRGARQALPAPAASPVPRAGRLLLAPLAQTRAGARAGLVARGGCSVRGALGRALEGLTALGQPLHRERGLGHPALFRRCREGVCRGARLLLYTSSPGGKPCLCKYTSKGQISII